MTTVADNFAIEDMDIAFQIAVGRFGVDVILVAFEATPASPVWRVNEIGRHLGELLEAAHCGEYDGTASGHGRLACFYHSRHLGQALEVLKRALDELALLPLAQILVAEPEHEKLREYYPPSAALV